MKSCLATFVDIYGIPKAKVTPLESFEHLCDGSELYTVGAVEGLGLAGPQSENGLNLFSPSGAPPGKLASRYGVQCSDLALPFHCWPEGARFGHHRSHVSDVQLVSRLDRAG